MFVLCPSDDWLINNDNRYVALDMSHLKYQIFSNFIALLIKYGCISRLVLPNPGKDQRVFFIIIKLRFTARKY